MIDGLMLIYFQNYLFFDIFCSTNIASFIYQLFLGSPRIFIGAMGPPGAGRPFMTGRYQRHFNLVFAENSDGLRILRFLR